MEAESYGDEATAAFINESFIPFTVNIKEHGALFHRFDVLWTPTVLIMDSNGEERDRIEGYLPRNEFQARLEMGLARVAFTAKHWEEAEKRYAQVAERYPDTPVTAEAIYWRGVTHYKGTNDHTILGEVARQLSQKYPESEWAKKASVWAH